MARRLVTSGNLGASGELFVAADLLRQHRDVYRSLSPASACDLVVIDHGRVLKVEVRTGHLAESRSLPTCAWTDFDRNKDADVLAVVVQHGPLVFYLNPRTGRTPAVMQEFVWGVS